MYLQIKTHMIYYTQTNDLRGEHMSFAVLGGLLLPFIGTTLGAACVFFMKNGMHPTVQKILTGFAAGVMVAASIWSLIIPAIDQAADMGKWSFVPAVIGFWMGILMLLALDRLIPHMHLDMKCEGPQCSLQKSTMLVFAVALHNLPEGMAVGVVFAGWIAGNELMSLSGALILALGIAIQNFPEGAIISMPLSAEGVSKRRAFGYGVLSGIIEPIGAIITILAAEFFTPILPYCLSLAAGAMFYVVVEELIPEMSEGNHSNIGTIAFAVGFSLMMILDVALG